MVSSFLFLIERGPNMKQLFIFFAALAILLAACAAPPANILAVTQTTTASASLTPEDTSTALRPTLTPALDLKPDTSTPDTPTRTPLPTIPTFTPTFDMRTIVTATPAPRAECPQEKPDIDPEFPECIDGRCDWIREADVLNYLNSGGMLEKADKVFSAHSNPSSIDLTGDGRKDVILRVPSSIVIYGCKGGEYQELAVWGWNDLSGWLDEIVDLNKNGIPEIIVAQQSRYGFITLSMYEWNGHEFRSLIEVEYLDKDKNIKVDGVSTVSKHQILDTNRDGLKEIIVVNNAHNAFLKGFYTDLISKLPFRDGLITLGWNGRHYVNLTQKQYTLPQYRFQAVQDGDWATLYGDYAKAFSSYQEAIFSDNLEWWSPERKEYERKTYFSQDNVTPSVYPTPTSDPTEYPRLAAYAYYRMVILHTFLGETEAAQIKYTTLQEKFPTESPGHPHVEMATDFWNTYQSSGKMYNACAAAIAYADSHPEILIPLGSDYHGAQSHTYVPADVCPFR